MTTILVVDDSSNERNGLCRLLENAGYDVRSAADGLEALQKLRDNSFDLLLLDIWMPRMNGIELLSLLPGDSRPRALIISGDESPEVLLRSLRQHAYLFVSKPVDPEELLQLVKTALESPPDSDPIEVVSAEPSWVELRFPCVLPVAHRIENVVDQLNYTLPTEVRHSIRMALHELLINAIEWGGQFDASAQAQMEYLRTRRFVMCVVADPGEGFDPTASDFVSVTTRPNGPIAHSETRAARGMRPGGFGIQLARSLVDELVYNEAHNEVAMVKYLH